MALDRYHRQMLLPDFGETGQRRLHESHAIIIGCGALGCTVADLLARAGVGVLTLIDRDIVERTNLQRQVLFDENDAAEHTPKALAAKQRLERVNSAITLNAVVADFSSSAERLVQQLQREQPSAHPVVLIDGTDNFETRYLVNDLAVKMALPLMYAGVVGTSAMAMPIIPPQAGTRFPCLRCLFPDPPSPGSQPTCDTAGVLGPVVSIVAGYQACESMKMLLGRWDLVQRSLLSFDAWRGHRTRLDLSDARDPSCPCCSQRSFAFLDRKDASTTTSLCGHGAVQVSPGSATSLDLEALARRLAPHGRFKHTEHLVIGELYEERGDDNDRIGIAVFADGRAQIRGTESPERARSVYARFVGA